MRSSYPTSHLAAPRRAGFSLVELLVVIAIIAILIALLFPALGICRRLARQTREAAAGAQLMAAYTTYANESKGQVLPGYAPDAMVTGGAGSLRVIDERGEPVTGQLAKRYPWRIAPYLDYNFRGLYDDPRVYEAYSRDNTLADADRRYIISVSPTFGINADFVGGKAAPGLGFNPNALRAFGPFYVTRLDAVRHPARLLVFTSARGIDGSQGTQFAGGIVPGFHMVNSPRLQGARWSAGPIEPDNPDAHGNVDPRHDGMANVAHADGHIDKLTLDDLRDMTRWANQAATAQWTLGTN